MRPSPSTLLRRPAFALKPVVCTLVCMGVFPAAAQITPTTLPSGLLSSIGIMTPQIDGATMTIMQQQARAIAQWNSFSIGADATVRIVQPTVASVLLNRVAAGGAASEIAGRLNTELAGMPGVRGGSVFLINPAGVTFSKGSSVSVGGLVASTLDLADSDFLAGGVPGGQGKMELRFTGDPASKAAVTVEEGATIEAANRGLVALVGAQVRNSGSIDVAQGTAGLLAGSEAVLVIDPAGDGLTTFRIPVDGQALAALAENAGVISADGGRVVLQANSAQDLVDAVRQTGTIRARSLENRGGEIVLSASGGEIARNVVQVEGTLDIAGGGSLHVQGDVVRVGAADVRGAADASGRNSQWTVASGSEGFEVHAPEASPSGEHVTAVAASALGKALGQGVDATLEATSETSYSGVTFTADAKVRKTEGGASTLTVNSTRNIEMMQGSAIQSEAGALNVAFNADAKGSIDSDAIPGVDTDLPRRGAIVLDGARIETDGGDIRFYGQSDPVNGRAVGGELRSPPSEFVRLTGGIELTNSVLSTCAVAMESCAGGGEISLRGEGYTRQILTEFAGVQSPQLDGSEGVTMRGAQLTTGAGGITVHGRGGIGEDGIFLGNSFASEEDAPSVLRSALGDITLIGASRDWTDGDPVGAGVGAGEGVYLSSSEITTGGGVRIDGTGGNIIDLIENEEFLRVASGTFTGTSFHSAGEGVSLQFSSISAGQGRTVDVAGTAGSRAFNVTTDDSGNPVVVFFTDDSRAIDVSNGAIRAEGGRIALDGRGGDVTLDACCSDSTAEDPALVLSTASATGPGGSIDIRGRNVLLEGISDAEAFGYTRLDSSGAGQAGQIEVHGSGMVAIDSNVLLSADALSATGQGGMIRALGDTGLRAHGDFSVRGGDAGGDGGFIETSAPRFALDGIRVDASAPAGAAGTWLIDPYDVTIVDGAATGSLTSNPFEPLATSTIQDADINAVLDKGTSVTITTGTTGDDQGDINFGSGVVIERTVGDAPVTFQLDAERAIGQTPPPTGGGFVPTIIRSTTGPMDVVFNAKGVGGGFGNGILYEGQIATGGGDIQMTAGTASLASRIDIGYIGSMSTGGGDVSITALSQGQEASFGYSGSISFGQNSSIVTDGGAVTVRNGRPGELAGAIFMNDSEIDTRAGQSDAGAGGAVQLEAGYVALSGVRIASSTGDVRIRGAESDGHGVLLGAGQSGPTSISTTTGNVVVEGTARRVPSSAYAAAHGVLINGGSSIGTGAGDIAVRGFNVNSGSGLFSPEDSGVRLENGAQLLTTAGGHIELTGRALGSGMGLVLQPGGSPTAPGAAPGIQGSGNVVLRAANDGSADAIVIEGPVVAAGAINLRPGGVDEDMNIADDTATPITLGGASVNGFSISGAEFAQLSAPTIVAGSDVHAADITVAGALATPGALTLQNEGGGGIVVNASVSAAQLGLVSAGDVSQSASAALSAGSLLARSGGGSVELRSPLNSVGTVGGGAAGSFGYVNADALTLGPVSVTGFDAAGNQPQVVAASSMAADSVFARTLGGDLSLAAGVSGTASTDLVAAARFQNPGGFGITGAVWRVWADTWVGEARGGLAGSGPLPNLYNCAYLGACGVTVTPGDNHFIYAQQPVATVTVQNAERDAGQPNPPFGYTLSGLILGDTDASFGGTLGSPATPDSPPGTYPIDGSFASAAGYAVEVVPGELTVREPVIPFIPRPLFRSSVELVRDMPLTYTYDRNIGPAPICLATGPLDGDRALQGSDVLAREWSRVRSRPNLTNCIDTERRNGCGDF